MKRAIQVIFILFMGNLSHSQDSVFVFTYKDFEQEVLAYKPIQRNSVSKNAYLNGVMILNAVKMDTENDPKKFNGADYWNVAVAFSNLNEPKNNVQLAFQKIMDNDKDRLCQYLARMKHNFNELVPGLHGKQLNYCSRKENIKEDKAKDEPSYGDTLVKKMKSIQEKDQRYRKLPGNYFEDKALKVSQMKLDEENQKSIDSLYRVHKTYIGESKVGRTYGSIMFIVIQHSNLKMMEKYLPVILQAAKNREIPSGNLRLLIDRICSIKYDYQIFGTQGGVKMANQDIREKWIKQYRLN